MTSRLSIRKRKQSSINMHIIQILSIYYLTTLSNAFNLFSFRQSTTSTSNTLTKPNPIIGVGPFLGDDRYTECVHFLQSSSTDGKLYQDGYTQFISLYSYGYVNSTTFRGLQDYSLAYINLYYIYSCNPQCKQDEFVYGALKSNAIQILDQYKKGSEYCCEGTQPYIEIEDATIDSLFYICAYADEYIREDIESMTDAPSRMPSVVASNRPTVVESGMPSFPPTVTPTVTPTAGPTKSPTSKPTFRPTPRPTNTPTNEPTLSPTSSPTNTPTKSPTNNPTISPTTANPSSSPSNLPTIARSDIPSINPTSFPTKTPTKSPTNNPTITPTTLPSQIPSTSYPTTNPTSYPTTTPTTSPTASFQPTAFGKHRTEFAYRITVLGYDAEDIMTRNNNTIMEDLISATTIVVKRVLAQGDPCIPVPERRLTIKRLNKARKLAEYREYSPVEILSVIDVECQGLAKIQQDNNLETNCILIRSAVTIYCTDPEEDCEEIQSEVINGIRDSIENGCFFEALPAQ